MALPKKHLKMYQAPDTHRSNPPGVDPCSLDQRPCEHLHWLHFQRMCQSQGLVKVIEVVMNCILIYLHGFDCVWMARSRTGTRFKTCITLPWIVSALGGRFLSSCSFDSKQNFPSGSLGWTAWTGVKSWLMCFPALWWLVLMKRFVASLQWNATVLTNLIAI